MINKEKLWENKVKKNPAKQTKTFLEKEVQRIFVIKKSSSSNILTEIIQHSLWMVTISHFQWNTHIILYLAI